MKKVRLNLESNWNKIPQSMVCDPFMPIAAEVVSAYLKNKDEDRDVSVALYKTPMRSNAKMELVKKCTNYGILNPWFVDVEFAGHDAAILTNPSHLFLAYEDNGFIVLIETYDRNGEKANSSRDEVKKRLEWLEKHVEVYDDGREDKNTDEKPLVGAEELWNNLPFTKDDYEETQDWWIRLPRFFGFLSEAVRQQAETKEELCKLIGESYDNHGGFHNVDYKLLDKDLRSWLEENMSYYVGIGRTPNAENCSKKKPFNLLVRLDEGEYYTCAFEKVDKDGVNEALREVVRSL